MLRLLKRSNADTKTLIVVYITVIRPILEYACQVWHYDIENFLSEDIERIQKRALKIIAPSSSYGEALKITGITTLYDRRENMNNDKMTDLFPDPYTSNYDLGLPRKFNNYVCKTDRFKQSFSLQMISKKNNRIIQYNLVILVFSHHNLFLL